MQSVGATKCSNSPCQVDSTPSRYTQRWRTCCLHTRCSRRWRSAGRVGMQRWPSCSRCWAHARTTCPTCSSTACRQRARPASSGGVRGMGHWAVPAQDGVRPCSSLPLFACAIDLVLAWCRMSMCAAWACMLAGRGKRATTCLDLATSDQPSCCTSHNTTHLPPTLPNPLPPHPDLLVSPHH